MRKNLSLSWLVICLVLFLLVAIHINILLPYPPAVELLIELTPSLLNWQAQGDAGRPIPEEPFGNRQTTHTAQITYASEEAGLSQFIYQFKNCSDAREYYSQEIAEPLSRQITNDGWIALPDIEYVSAVASQSILACNQATSNPVARGCTYVAQYGIYVIKVSGGWFVNYQFDEDSFREILEAVDQKMSSWYRICIPG